MSFRIHPTVLDRIRDDKRLKNDREVAEYLGTSSRTVAALRSGSQPGTATLIALMQAVGTANIYDVITDR